MRASAAIAAAALLCTSQALAGGLEYDPHILIVEFSDGMRIEAAATSAATCETAIRAIRSRLWRLNDERSTVTALECVPGNRFAAGSDCLAGYNCPGDRR